MEPSEPPSSIELKLFEQLAGVFAFFSAVVVAVIAFVYRITFSFEELKYKAISVNLWIGVETIGLRTQWEAQRFAMYFLTLIAVIVGTVTIARSYKEGAGCAALFLSATGVIIGIVFAQPSSAGFLTNLLKPLVTCGNQCATLCTHVREAVEEPRYVGHVAAGFLAASVSSAILFGSSVNRQALVSRVNMLRWLMLAVSGFFVTGVLTTRAAFTWVLALWKAPHDLDTATLLSGGVEHAAITYSAILLSLLIIVRWIVGRLAMRIVVEVEKHAPGTKGYDEAIKDFGLDNVLGNFKQALTVLAPLLAGALSNLLN